MIKRLLFGTRNPAVSRQDCVAAVRRAAAATAAAPAGGRPVRVTVCTDLPEITMTSPDAASLSDIVRVEWFPDEAGLERFRGWLAGPAGQESARPLDEVLLPAARATVVADELVARGAQWLERRWRDIDRITFKHLAMTRRAPGLTPAEFSRRWAEHAGRVRAAGAAAAVVIPEPVRGLAYVQNHPRPRAVGEWPYDAVNEVFFDDVDGLWARVDWFRGTVAGGVDPDLFDQPHFLAAREEILVDRPGEHG